MHEPLDKVTARSTVRRILKTGTTTFTDPHAITEMRKDKLQQIDVLNVLRGGWVEPAEWENGAWRYQVRTQRIVVVIEFDYEDANAVEKSEELTVITVWRIQ